MEGCCRVRLSWRHRLFRAFKMQRTSRWKGPLHLWHAHQRPRRSSAHSVDCVPTSLPTDAVWKPWATHIACLRPAWRWRYGVLMAGDGRVCSAPLDSPRSKGSALHASMGSQVSHESTQQRPSSELISYFLGFIECSRVFQISLKTRKGLVYVRPVFSLTVNKGFAPILELFQRSFSCGIVRKNGNTAFFECAAQNGLYRQLMPLLRMYCQPIHR